MSDDRRLQNLRPWKKGESGNPAGKTKGLRNRATIAKRWLETEVIQRNPISGAEEQLSQEDLITLAQVKKAREGDTAAYKALMDSAHGMPKQTVEQETTVIRANLTTGILRTTYRSASGTTLDTEGPETV